MLTRDDKLSERRCVAGEQAAELVRRLLASHPEQWFYSVGTTVVNATERDTRKAARVIPAAFSCFVGRA